MGSDWKKVVISDVCELIVDCINKTAPIVNYATDYRMIRTPNIKDGRVSLAECRFVEAATFLQWTRRAKVLKDDVLLTREAPLGQVGIVNKTANIFLGQRIMQYRADTSKLHPNFLVYSFLSPDLQHQFSMHEGSGSVVSHIRVADCLKFELYIPPLIEQTRIANILSTLDDKIELNNQTNQTLEQMAQALFKSWFVDFDPVIDNALAAGNAIPDELQERAERRQQVLAAANTKRLPAAIQQLFPSDFEESATLGPAPSNWTERTFLSLIKLIGGGTPKTTIEEYWNGDIPWFSVVDAPKDSDIFVIKTEKHISQLGVDKSSTKILREGTTIITARGTVGKCALVGKPMAMNQSCYGLNGLEGISDEYIYFLTRYQVMDLQKRSHGSVFSTITGKTFESIKLPFAGGPLTQAFKAEVNAIFQKVLQNNKQTDTLTKLRDTLLPKLISGELQIPDAAQQRDAALA